MNRNERFLKSLHNFVYRFGLDISLVKKEEAIDAIEYNSIVNANKYWDNERTKQVWDSPEYKEFYTLLLDSLVPYNINFDNQDWADVGCGSGTLLLFLKERYKPKMISGFEISKSAVEISKNRIPEGNFAIYNLYEEPAEKSDIIFCTEVLEHLLEPDIAIRNLQKRMHEKSLLIITVPNGRKDTWGGHINFWSPESWKMFIEKNVAGKKFVTGKLKDRAVFALIYGHAYQSL